MSSSSSSSWLTPLDVNKNEYRSPHLYPNGVSSSTPLFKRPTGSMTSKRGASASGYGGNGDSDYHYAATDGGNYSPAESEHRLISPFIKTPRSPTSSPKFAAINTPGLRYYAEHDEELTSYRHRNWESEGMVDTLAMNAAIRTQSEMSNQLSDIFMRKLSISIRRKVFRAWKGYTKLHTTTRDAMLRCLRLKYVGRRFYAWRFCAKLSKLFRRILKSYWKRHRRRRFMWWKAVTQWKALKEDLYRRNLDRWLLFMRYHQSMKEKWARLGWLVVANQCVMQIQAVWRWHRPRLEFWAKWTIKTVVLRHFLLKIHMRRKRLDDARKRSEDASVSDMVNRGNLYLRKLLQDRDGKALFDIYISEVEKRWKDKPNRHLLFPSKEQMPDLYLNWTLRGKAMHILRYRCEAEVKEFTRAKFRGMQLPMYSCRRCDETFIFKWQKVGHVARCRGTVVKKEPTYLCWNLARPLVDAAAAPLVSRFFRREQMLAAKLYGTVTPHNDDDDY